MYYVTQKMGEIRAPFPLLTHKTIDSDLLHIDWSKVSPPRQNVTFSVSPPKMILLMHFKK